MWIVRFLGGGLRKFLGTSHAESMSAAANIFVGQAEAPLVVKPFIPTMTRSELFAVMVGGLSTIAGSVMAGYVALGIPLEYLVTASFMAAPGGLMMEISSMRRLRARSTDSEWQQRLRQCSSPLLHLSPW